MATEVKDDVSSSKAPAGADRAPGFSTLCIHAGNEPDPATGSVTFPIYQTSTYVQEGLGKHKGFEYARTQNPTRMALEGNVAAIEGGKAGFAFASGMAAIGAIATLLQAGDHVVVSDNTYGGTFRLFDKVLTRYGFKFSYVDTSDLAAVEKAEIGIIGGKPKRGTAGHAKSCDRF